MSLVKSKEQYFSLLKSMAYVNHEISTSHDTSSCFSIEHEVYLNLFGGYIVYSCFNFIHGL